MNQSVRNNTLVVFVDYDDTLLPTSYLCSLIDTEDLVLQKEKETGKIEKFWAKSRKQEEIKANLERVGASACDLLDKLHANMPSSQIKIVTNASLKWVENTLKIASKYSESYKKMKDMLDPDQNPSSIKVSARPKGCDHYKWKVFAYDHHMFNEMNLNKEMNVLTIGDQWDDHRSLWRTSAFQLHQRNISHLPIKFDVNPSCRRLAHELQFLAKTLLPSLFAMN